MRRAKSSPEPSPATSVAATTSETPTAASVQQTSASISQRGRRRSAKKYWQIEETADPRDEAEAVGELFSANDDQPTVDDACVAPTSDVCESAQLDDVTDRTEDGGRYFQFELLPVHTGSRNRLGRKMFECDVCSGVYRHGFSLKRHYLRNHINRRYISRVDALNCGLTFCGDDDDVDDVTGRRLAPRRPKVSPVAASESRETSATCSSLDSGTSASRSGDDGAVLQMDVEEIDPQDSTGNVDGDRPRLNASDFPGLYRCYVCERHFDAVAELKTHACDSKAGVGSGKRFACRHCQMQFRHRQNLVRHELVHTGRLFTADDISIFVVS